LVGARSFKLVAALCLVLAFTVAASANPQRALVIEYGEALCPDCVKQKQILESLNRSSGVPYLYVELMGNETNVKEFDRIYELAVGGELRATPLLVLVVEGRAKAVAVGPLDESELLNLIERAQKAPGFLVAVGGDARELADNSRIEEVQKIIDARLSGSPYAAASPEEDASRVLPLLLTLAAADSVNPCTFAVYTALLLVVLTLRGRKGAALSALSFAAAVYACYYALGLGLVAVSSLLPHVFVKAVAAVGIAVGLYSIAANLGGRFKSPVPEPLKRVTEAALMKVAGPAGAAALGALCSFTLLPCSSGPYVVFAAVLSRVSQPALRYLLLGLYNAVFVSPLLAIAAAVSALNVAAKRVKGWRSEEVLARMELAGSALLIAVCVYLLLAY